MALSSGATLFCLQEEEIVNHHNQEVENSPGEGDNDVMAAASPRRKRNNRGNPSPDAEVVALSPKTIMARNLFWCEVCNKGFQREQNLQLHRRGHNLPGKLKRKTNHEVTKKVYVCPEPSCVHHDPSRALGDLGGIKKHFSRKHGEKKFNCQKCNKKYAVYYDWKAHNKICGTKEYPCDCGTTFFRHDSFIFHRSNCVALVEDVARNTNLSPYSSMDTSILANSSNPISMSLPSAAGSLIPQNHQKLSSPSSVGSAFQPIHSFSESKFSLPRAYDSSGIHRFPSYTTQGNMPNFGCNGGSDLNYPKNGLNLNINNSFSGLLMNAETSAYNTLNSTPFPQFVAPTHFQKAPLTRAHSENVAHMNSIGNSLFNAMKFNKYWGANCGDKMSGGGRVGNSTNVGGGSTLGYKGGTDYVTHHMNAPYGGMLYNVRNADGMLVGEVTNNVCVEPDITGHNGYYNKLMGDFLGMGNGMNIATTGLEDDAIGIETNSAHTEATISVEARTFVPTSHPGF